MLDFVGFNALVNWSVQYLGDSVIKFNRKYPLMRIGDFLTRNKTGIEIQDDETYKRATIRVRNGGIYLRDTQDGRHIGTKKQFLIKAGQFLLSKIDARNGAFGVVPDELDGGIITGNFWTFDVDYAIINPHYLTLLTTTKQFIDFCEQASNGTTNRHYLQEPLFLNIKVPVPSLEEQNKLVEIYNASLSKADDLEQAVQNNRQQFYKDMFDILGIELMASTSYDNCLLHFVNFKTVSRWDFAYIQQKYQRTSKYNLHLLNTCITNFLKGDDMSSLRIETKKHPARRFKYIGMENVVKNIGKVVQINEVDGKTIKSSSVCVPKGYILYGKLRPYLNKYWYNDKNDDNIICSSEFFVFKLNPEINIHYFLAIISSELVQVQLADKMSGARMPRITEEIFHNIRIPIPPQNIQNTIANMMLDMNNDNEVISNQIVYLRNNALLNFENQIFE